MCSPEDDLPQCHPPPPLPAPAPGDGAAGSADSGGDGGENQEAAPPVAPPLPRMKCTPGQAGYWGNE